MECRYVCTLFQSHTLTIVPYKVVGLKFFSYLCTVVSFGGRLCVFSTDRSRQRQQSEYYKYRNNLKFTSKFYEQKDFNGLWID